MRVRSSSLRRRSALLLGPVGFSCRTHILQRGSTTSASCPSPPWSLRERHSTSSALTSGGEQYIHNQKENSQRQEVLHRCFRASSAAAFRKSGIVSQAAQAARNERKDGCYTMLEIGCGSGATTLDLARQLPKSAKVVGLDANADMIAAANERLRQLPEHEDDLHSRVEFRLLSGEQAAQEYGVGSFDAVWMRFVLVHVPNPLQLVEAAAQCLKPGTGTLLIEDVNAEGFFSDPHFAAHALINARHIEASLQLGADVRRGPWVGGLMRQAGDGQMLDCIQCNSFVPMFGKGITFKPWVEDNSQEVQDRLLDPSTHYKLGVQLADMSLESLAPKFLELGVCTKEELEEAQASFESVKDSEYQVFSFPGGQIFQWWAQRSEARF